MTPEARVAETVRLFLRRVDADKMPVSGDLRVTERDAAALLGIAEGSLRNLRNAGDGPACVRMGVAGSRISYSVVDLARWIERLREP